VQQAQTTTVTVRAETVTTPPSTVTARGETIVRPAETVTVLGATRTVTAGASATTVTGRHKVCEGGV
jgi:hypothetical protein